MSPAVRFLPFGLAFFSSLCIMILELVASRLVARHVGASLNVWTSVIGVMLGGICLGNFLGGRLADRVDARKAVGPLYGLGAMLTLACLWTNILGASIPELEALPWFRSIALVVVDFLIPGAVLGMVSPVVAKLAVEQSKRTGSAIGDVYTMGAVGSIVGTFIAGFWLMYIAPTSSVVMIVAAGLSLLAGLMSFGPARILGLLATVLLTIGAMPIPGLATSLPSFLIAGEVPLNPLTIAGQAVAALAGLFAIVNLYRAREVTQTVPGEMGGDLAKVGAEEAPSLRDLAILSFIISFAFMAFEMTAGRLVTRHLGSSIYGWTSIIGVLLGGLSFGNFLGGKLADFIKSERGASTLFLIASVLVLSVLIMETPPNWFVRNPIGHFIKKEPRVAMFEGAGSALSSAIVMTGQPWPRRVLFVVAVVFLLPSIALGTVSPVVAKLAVERFRSRKKTGAAIGGVYAWGMVGSILGTFLAGFVLIDSIGTKGVILLVGTVLALSATMIGSIWHAAWAGIPLGLCVIAFVPHPWFEKQGLAWGIREEQGDPKTEEDARAWIDESDYYYIKVENEPDADGQKRTLVLDNLIHGYFILGHPERLDYDYEHIYAMVTYRIAKAKVIAAHQKEYDDAKTPADKQKLVDAWLKDAGLSTMFLGGGAYTFPRHLQNKYPGTKADVAEIDPAVTNANKVALGLGSAPTDADIVTTFGDARQFVERNQGKKSYDVIYGDAFNDFSVPWHLTTKEFNDKLGSMLAKHGAYMINIIDVYRSDARADELAERAAKKEARELKLDAPTPEMIERHKAEQKKIALENGGFLGSWVETARKTFPHVYVFGTAETPGEGLRETFVVVVSRVPIDVDQLGGRDDDPKFFNRDKLFEPKPYGDDDMKAVATRSRGIILTDDYAPVENLLAPVAETRGDD